MAVGTVRGRFVLDAPALRTLRDLEKQGIKTQAQMKSLGDQMDRVADKEDLARLKAYGNELDRMGRKTVKAATESERAWALYERRVNGHLDSIIARIELAHQRLNAFGRERATPSVGSGGVGGFGGLTGGGGGGGGGGGSSLFGGGLSPTRVPKTPVGLLGAVGVGLPAVQAGVATVGALAGSAGMGLAGGGAVGAAGIGALAGGGALTMATIKPMAEAIGQAADAQKDLNLAVRQFGRDSEEARKAARDLRLAYRAAPEGTRALLGERERFRSAWARRARPAQGQLLGGATTALGTLRRGLLPTAGRAALTTAVTSRHVMERGARFAGGETGQQFLNTSAGMWAENLPVAERSLENVFRTFVNVQRAARPFFRESMDWLRDWTRSWADGTEDIGKTRDRIGEMVEHLKSWVRLGGSSARLLGNLMSAGAPAGQSTVERMTAVMDRWNDWIRRHPGEVRSFFRRSVSAAEDFSKALWDIVKAVGRLSDDLLPVLEHFPTLISGASALGLLTPGAGALAFGAFRGGRGGGGGGAPGAAGGAGGGIGPALAAGAVGAGFARGGAGIGRAGALRYGAGFRPGAPTSQLGARGFRYGPQSARGARLVGGLPTAAGGAVRGAGRAFAPIAAIMGALDFAGTPGNVFQRGQAALSGATLGVIPRPQLGAEVADNVQRRVDRRISDLPQGPRGQREAIRRERSMLESGGDVFAGTGADSGNIRAGNKALREDLRNRIAAFRDYRQQIRGMRLERTSRDIERAFEIRLRKGPGAAIKGLIGDTLRGFHGLGREGKQALAENSLTWAREQARRNPELAGVYRQLRRRIIKQFRDMGQEIKIINGQIFTGSKKEWGNIASALSTASERAYQEVKKNFTAIQRQAVGSLRAMGFSPSQARALVQAEEGGGGGRQYARETIRLGQSGSAPSRQSQQNRSRGGRLARGGRIWGSGTGDNVSLGGGNKGAPGELIVNKHTEADVDHDLARAGRAPLAARVGRETRPHSSPIGRAGSRRNVAGHTSPKGFRYGGSTGGGIVAVPGFPGERAATSVLPEIAQIARRFGVRLTDAFGPGHQSPGHTVYGTAADFSGPDADMDRAVRSLVAGGYKVLYDGRFGSTAWPGHGPSYVAGGNAHFHVELGGAGTIGARGRGAPGGSPGGRIRLRSPRTRQRGVPGALSQRAGDMYAAGLQRKINRRVGRGGGGGPITGGGNAAANQRVARRMLSSYGWGGDQWGALQQLWQGESGWSQTARNPSSGAYGIPQALPASKMGAAAQGSGPEAARAQIRWGLDYIKGRYGSPSGALGAWRGRSPHWYGTGGRIPSFRNGGSFTTGAGRGALFMAGDNPYRREQVTVRPLRPKRRPALPGLGGGGVSVTVNMGDVTVRNSGDIGRLADAIADRAGKKLLVALEGMEEVIGG